MKRKKSFLLLSALALSLGCVGVVTFTNIGDNNLIFADADKNYDMKLDNSNGFTNANYSIATQTKTIGLVTLNGFLAKAYDGGFAKLASRGSIYNYSKTAEYNGRVTGINSIKVTFTGGELKLRVSRDLSGKIFSDAVALTSGTAQVLTPVSPNFFILEAGDSEVSIEKIEINYNCSERNGLSLYQLGKTYTGEKDGIVYKAIINNDTFTIDTLNKENNDHYAGTVSVEANQVKFAVSGIGNIYFNPNEGRNKLTVDASKGIGGLFSGLAFDEVFKVDDFENLVEGSGYDDITKSFTTMTGLRSKFLSDFNNSEASRTTSPLGWKLMGSGDYLRLGTGVGHNGTNAAVFKVSNTSGLRYVTMPSLYNVPKTLGKGSTFSFWAHGPVNQAGTAPAANNAKIKVRVFFANPITTVGDSTGDYKEFTIPSGSDWTRYEMPLASNKEFYGYCIYSNSASGYLPIDDVEIFTANPYAEYVEEHNYQAFTGKGDIEYDSTLKAALGSDGTYFNFGISRDGYAKGYLIGQTFKGTSYDIDENRVLTVEGALVPSQTVTQYGLEMTGLTGTFNEDYSVLSNVTLLGSTGGHIANNGSITLSASELSEVADFTGATTTILQNTFQRWYMADKWTKDPGNADRTDAYTNDGYNDSICMRVRGHAKHSLTFKENFNPTKSYHGFGFWVKNSSSKTLKTRYFSYQTQDLTDGATWMEVESVTKADGWSLIVCDFQGGMAIKSGITNLRLYFEMSGGTQTDYIYLDHLFFY